MTTTPALNDDLVRRLRSAPPFGTTRLWDERLADEAAAALEAQSKEIEALRAALERIASLEGTAGSEFIKFDGTFHQYRGVTASEIARTALKGA